MAKSAQIGEIRTWSNGQKYQKTAKGWVPVKAGSKGNAEQEEAFAKEKSPKGSESPKQDYQIKQGAWNEDIPVKNLPYGKGDVSYLKERFPDAKVSAYIDDENEDYEVSVSLSSKNGDVNISIFDDGRAEISYKDSDGTDITQEANLYYDDDFDEALMNAGVFDEEGDSAGSENKDSQFEKIDPSKINDVSELYDKVPGLSNEDIDAQFDENYEYYKEEMSSSEEDDIFSEALADTVKWVNKQGMKASQEKGDQDSQQQSYSPEQLADYAKSASDEGLKRAASSGDEQMRVAAKKEIARRKNEGMENDTDNPFDKGSIQKSKKEERIYKGQVYEKIDGGWIKKK